MLSVNGGMEAGGQSGVRTEVNSIRKSWGWQGEARPTLGGRMAALYEMMAL